MLRKYYNVYVFISLQYIQGLVIVAMVDTLQTWEMQCPLYGVLDVRSTLPIETTLIFRWFFAVT
jgi:hypothetical protein